MPSAWSPARQRRQRRARPLVTFLENSGLSHLSLICPRESFRTVRRHHVMTYHCCLMWACTLKHHSEHMLSLPWTQDLHSPVSPSTSRPPVFTKEKVSLGIIGFYVFNPSCFIIKLSFLMLRKDNPFLGGKQSLWPYWFVVFCFLLVSNF